MDLGWYCRNLQNQPHTDPNDSSEDEASQVDYHRQYMELKKKLKFLIYENEFFQDSLNSAQRRLLKATRDRSFLLDRLLQYEKPDETSESETDSDVSDAPKTEAKK
jgi:INO80 complex subunit E